MVSYKQQHGLLLCAVSWAPVSCGSVAQHLVEFVLDMGRVCVVCIDAVFWLLMGPGVTWQYGNAAQHA